MTLLLVALVGGLIAMDGVSLVQSMVSRPLPTGFLIGLLLGDPWTGVQVGALLELYLLVEVPTGGGRFPEGAVAAVAATVAAVSAPGPAGLAVGVAGGLVWGWVGGFTQGWLREANGRIVPVPGEFPVTEGAVVRAVGAGLLLDFLRGVLLCGIGALLALRLAPGFAATFAPSSTLSTAILVGGGLVSIGILLRASVHQRHEWVLMALAAAVGWVVA